MPFGVEMRAGGEARFRLWAPACDQVGLEIAREALPMCAQEGGWHELTTAAPSGTPYRFVLPDGTRVPDPASRYQPGDLDGPSELIDPHAWDWQDTGWTGRPWEEAVIYEMHIGAFTPEGTFRAAMSKLDCDKTKFTACYFLVSATGVF